MSTMGKYYAMRATDKETGHSISRVAGCNTDLGYRVYETISAVLITDEDTKTRIMDLAIQDGDISDKHLLEIAEQQFDYEVYPILVDIVDNRDSSEIPPNEPFCYAQMLLAIREDFDKFISMYCGNPITDFDFPENL